MYTDQSFPVTLHSPNNRIANIENNPFFGIAGESKWIQLKHFQWLISFRMQCAMVFPSYNLIKNLFKASTFTLLEFGVIKYAQQWI